MSRDREELRRALIASWPALLEELIGEPSRRARRGGGAGTAAAASLR
jgi:hypothetical protein